MSRRRGKQTTAPGRGLAVDPAVKAALRRAVVDRNADETQSEVLRLRSMLARIADLVGARAVVLGREAQVETLANIERRLGEHALLRENMHWREYAWLSCPHPGKYGDDGEMQCQGADFRRGKIEDLSEHLRLAREFEWEDRSIARLTAVVDGAKALEADVAYLVEKGDWP